MLRQFCLRVAAIVFISSSVAAGELPKSEAKPSWAGAYIGVSAAINKMDVVNDTYGWLQYYENMNIFGEGHETFSSSTKGPVLGLAAGYDFQFGNIVLGVFGDLKRFDFSNSQNREVLSDCNDIYNPNCFNSLEADLGSSVSIRQGWDVGARAGYLIDPSLLVYALAGYAQAVVDSETVMHVSNYQAEDFNVLAEKLPVGGLLLGFGLEKLIGSNMSLKGEFRHTEYFRAKMSYDSGDTLGPHYYENSQSTDVSETGVLLSWNYRFAEH